MLSLAHREQEPGALARTPSRMKKVSGVRAFSVACGAFGRKVD